MVDKKALFFAKMELYKFLQEHPKYIPFQKELEAKMDAEETPLGRLTVINKYMRENLEKLKEECKKLESIVSEMKDNIKEEE